VTTKEKKERGRGKKEKVNGPDSPLLFRWELIYVNKEKDPK